MLKKSLFFYFLLGSVSIAFTQESYYEDVNKEVYGMALKDALSTKTANAHSNILPYTSNSPDTWDAIKATDAFINSRFQGDVVLFYGWEDGSDQDDSNDYSRDERDQDTGNGDTFVWNREHVFPKSLANPKLDTDIPGPATDAHHLRAADRARNSTRNNRKYGRGTGYSDFSADTFPGLDGPETAAWYPGDQWKGDAARMIMYMYMRYGSVCLPTAVGVGSKKFTPDEMIDLFLQWNVEDKVSAIEIARNNYHENTSNPAAQGNRNPFIDNPYLATRIWGGNSAEDRWDYYQKTDTQAPTQAKNVTINAVTLNSMDVSWSASSDNMGVYVYNVYVNNILEAQTITTNSTISNLNTNTSYNVTIIAKDLINNSSVASAAATAKTLEDNEAPSVPENILIQNETDSSFKVTWSAATDNNAVLDYEVYIDGLVKTTTTLRVATIANLNASTSYSVRILAKDLDNNTSEKSNAINANTTAGTFNGISELFISEYIEPKTGNEKAIEIVNLTGATINLSNYSLQKQSNGATWVDNYNLGDSNIIPGDVFVIVHADVTNPILLQEADLFGPPNVEASSFSRGSPMNFNGNDPVGLYKNNILIDIIGEENNTSDHIQNKTYRRKNTITIANTRFDSNEWLTIDEDDDNFDNFGRHSSTLSTLDTAFKMFKMFPNPTDGNILYFRLTEDVSIEIYTILGKLVTSATVTQSKKNVDISNLSQGIYIVKIKAGDEFITKKLIKN
jgi:endonuclease I/chitodextrinase